MMRQAVLISIEPFAPVWVVADAVNWAPFGLLPMKLVCPVFVVSVCAGCPLGANRYWASTSLTRRSKTVQFPLISINGKLVDAWKYSSLLGCGFPLPSEPMLKIGRANWLVQAAILG